MRTGNPNGEGAPPYFYCSALPPVTGEWVLDGEEGRHAVAVRRLRAGDLITLFDGRGKLAQGRVTGVDPRRKTLHMQIESFVQESPPRTVTLAAALPKGDRLNVMLDMATQLGMTRFVPLDCERGVVKVSGNALKRWQRICLEACKQSRRAWLPELAAAMTPTQVIESLGDDNEIWIAHPGGDNLLKRVRDWAVSGRGLVVLVGPEGGFTADEVARMQSAGAHSVALGRNILRVEAAATAILACIAALP